MIREQRIEVADGVELRVLVRDAGRPTTGEGAPWLLVHGLASNAHLWDGVAAALAALGHRSAAVDLRGHGPVGRAHRLPEPGDLSLAAVADDLATVVQSLGWDAPVAVGQSWGGNVVVELAARHPHVVCGVVGIDGGTIELADYFADFEACASALSPPHLVGTPRSALEDYLRTAHPDWPSEGIAGQLANFETRADATIEPWLSRERHMTILRDLYEHRPSERWAALGDTPVMLVPAENDASPFDKRAEVKTGVAALKRSRVHWMRGDHDLHAQFPEKIAALLHEAWDEGFFR